VCVQTIVCVRILAVESDQVDENTFLRSAKRFYRKELSTGNDLYELDRQKLTSLEPFTAMALAVTVPAQSAYSREWLFGAVTQ